MTPEYILSKFGFIEGEPPRGLKCGGPAFLGFALIGGQIGEGEFDIQKMIVKPVWFCGMISPMTTNGWVGWWNVPICYHPKPLHFTYEKGIDTYRPDVWDSQFEELFK